jgi:hypothetical protein
MYRETGYKKYDRTKIDDIYRRAVFDNWAAISFEIINNYIIEPKKGIKARL